MHIQYSYFIPPPIDRTSECRVPGCTNTYGYQVKTRKQLAKHINDPRRKLEKIEIQTNRSTLIIQTHHSNIGVPDVPPKTVLRMTSIDGAISLLNITDVESSLLIHLKKKSLMYAFSQTLMFSHNYVFIKPRACRRRDKICFTLTWSFIVMLYLTTHSC